MNRVISDKLERLRGGEPARVLDLFSGCGGLMLGFARAGCTSVAGVDLDDTAARSYALNFHAGDAAHSVGRDITKLEPLSFLRGLGIPDPRRAVDLIIGGPPCPAFTRVGRAKLREIRDDPEAHLNDPRAKLYQQYLAFVGALKPVALLMENVPDVLNFGGRNVGEEIADELVALGYVCRYTLLNAANYGVPQLRERFFLLAVHESVGAEAVIGFPVPTNRVAFPSGYTGSRNVALKHIRPLERKTRYVPRPEVPSRASSAVSVRDAIGDLPGFNGADVMRRAAIGSLASYRKVKRLSPYAEEMRSWAGFEASASVLAHVTRALTSRDFRLFAQMGQGDDYPKAKALARRLLFAARAAGHHVDDAEYVPPYDETKFPNRWRKMEASKPARTLMAHLGKDSYSHIHYDGAQARTLSVREAARLQSFPDGFRFAGAMNAAFRQIGNAVPPLLAWHLAQSLLRTVLDARTSRRSIESYREDTRALAAGA